MQVVQVVKKFGLVGGMEEYAYRLSVELTQLGVEVLVLCEKSFSKNSTEAKIVELGENSKPNWFAHYKFSQGVNKWLAQHPCNKRIIHSHERQSLHHVTTFHTTPFNQGKPWATRFLSLRNFFYERLERRELFADSVKAIVPVSNLLGEMIKRKHPKSESLLKDAVHPGVFMETEGNASKGVVPPDGGTLGFIGKEWKRKGLPKVVGIWRELKKTRPKLKLRIAGVSPEMITHLFGAEDTDIEVLGLIQDKESFYTSIDLLVHPAKYEAFGMVITEALSMAVPVLCSSECGATETITDRNGRKIREDCPLFDWVASANEILDDHEVEVSFSRNWSEVAKEYLELYMKVLSD